MSSLFSSKPAGVIRRTERGTRLVAALLGAALAVTGGYFTLNRTGESIVSLSYDMPFMVHRAGGGSDIRIVYLDKLDQEMLDRNPQARLLDKLAEAGAKAVLYDIIFDTESKDPAVDIEFAAAMRRFRGVDQDGNPVAGNPRRHVFLACGRKTFSRTGIAGEQLIPPNDRLLDAADDFGVVSWDDDAFTIRKISNGTADEPSMIWKAATALGTGLRENSRMETRWLNFAGPPPDPTDRNASNPIISCGADDVMLGELNPELLRDKVVIIGGEPSILGEALGHDLFSTPFHRFQIGGKLPLLSGVEVQANGLANLMQANWLTRTSPRFDGFLIIFAGLMAGTGFTCLRPASGILVAITAIIACAIVGVLSIHYGRFWFPWSVTAFVQVPLALVWGIAAHSYTEKFLRIRITEEQKALREAFSKYLSPQMLDRMTIQDFKASLGGEKVHAAIMFTDLESFTDMCERVSDPARIVEVLNAYFQRTTGSIFDHDGVIIKFVGDAIFAAWGVPLPAMDAPTKAARAAWNLFENDKFFVEGVELRTRIGLHFDEVVAGNVGSARHMDYTLVGDAVNLTSRLEGLNKMLDTHILMSEAVQSRLDGEFRSRRVGKFRFKGRTQVTVVHELIGPVIQQREPEWIGKYHQATTALESGDAPRALVLFNEVIASRGARGDGPSQFFANLLESKQPVGDGIVDLKEK
jgi:adenylate cyclase